MTALSPQSSTYADLIQQGWWTCCRGTWSCVHDSSVPNLPQGFAVMLPSHSGLLSSSPSNFNCPPPPAIPILLQTYLPYLANIYFVLSVFPQWVRSPRKGRDFHLCAHCCIPSTQHSTWHVMGTLYQMAE